MRTPIAYALAYPERIAAGVAQIDLFQVARLDFSAPDIARFPCLSLAYQALRAGGTVPALLNAANEVAVAAFLDRQLPFTAIAEVVAETLQQLPVTRPDSLEQLLQLDAEARKVAEQAARERVRH